MAIEASWQEAAATQRGEAAVAAASADSERRVRQLNLQLEQLRDAAVQRDREAEQVNRERERAEKAARVAVEAEAAASRRVEGLERRLGDLHDASTDRDALLIKVEQLGRLVEMQAAELKRLQDSKAKGEARATALRRQIALERKAHKSAASRMAQQVRAQAEVAAFAADTSRGGSRGSGGYGSGGRRSGGSAATYKNAMDLEAADEEEPYLVADAAVDFEQSPVAAAAAYGGLSPVDYPRASRLDGTAPRSRSYGAISASEDEEEGDGELGESSDNEEASPPQRKAPTTPMTAAAAGGGEEAVEEDDDQALVALAQRIKRESREFASLLRAGAEGREARSA